MAMYLQGYENENSKKINSNVLFLSIATFLADIGGGLVNVVLPLFLTSLGLNKTLDQLATPDNLEFDYENFR